MLKSREALSEALRECMETMRSRLDDTSSSNDSHRNPSTQVSGLDKEKLSEIFTEYNGLLLDRFTHHIQGVLVERDKRLEERLQERFKDMLEKALSQLYWITCSNEWFENM